MNLNLDFNHARTKHMFFKTKVRGYLLGSDTNANTFQTYLNELGDWINTLGTKYDLRLSELLEASYLYNELVDRTNRLVVLRTSGKDTEAKEKFNEIETIGDKFISTLNDLEQQIKES